MAKYAFPAVFTPAEEGGYLVTFPDLENVFTDGENIEDSLANASDVLNLMLYDAKKDNIPMATPIKEIKAPEGGFVSMILADTVAYQDVIERENNPIKYARKKAKMNIKQLADLLGAPYRTVQEWNAGRRMPPKWVEKLVIEKIESV